jgi:hypothetical protein
MTLYQTHAKDRHRRICGFLNEDERSGYRLRRSGDAGGPPATNQFDIILNLAKI